MRKVLLTLLLAGVAASPALAQDSQPDGSHKSRAERQQARSERQAERDAARPERPERQAPRSSGFSNPSNPDNRVRQERSVVRQQAPAVANEWRNQVRDNRAVQQQQRVQVRDDRRIEQQSRLDAVRDRVQQHRDDRQTRLPPLVNGRPPVSHTPQPGTQPPPPTRTESYRPATNWNQNWRNRPQYDWRNHRNHHRSLFHLGFYYDPFGWGYQRYDIGWRMWPSYFSRSFWINDPWSYRLPYAPPGTRWVRYYDDAVLVDTWSGEVVDVIYNFFW